LHQTNAKSQAAEVIALQALAFLAADDGRLSRFLTLSGIDGASLRARAGEPELLAAVLDHVLGDESLLFVFCEAADLLPEAPRQARRCLPGGDIEV